jgi:parallel beta-helix repeat protein
MEKRLKLLPLLIVMILSVFTFADRLFPLTVSATYVEGEIMQDTIWTLLDSPFVVSKNVTVSSNATLTIEPGVEVRFGGNFSIIVRGRLNASGTPDKMITFTSNKYNSTKADWGTIILLNRTIQSTLAYCSVEYATNGITIRNASAEIQNCEITNNLQNGVTIENGTVEIMNNVISNNSQSGIYITGDNQITIQNNTIRANADGILLTGNLTSGVNITQNNVVSNTQSGIHLKADAYNNIVILDNILSTNNQGFYVSGEASTYITNNSIFNNTVGIFYQKPANYTTYWTHDAHWNDIYENQRGMDVSTDVNVTINAEYNYWGDKSGPYHVSLNPDGKGNPVGGDGVSLDFIFFLSAPIDYDNKPPTARLFTDKTLVSPNQTVMFIATASSDEGRVDKYLFDFGDGSNSRWTTLSVFVHEYSSVGTYNASLTVIDDFNVTNSNPAMTTIEVQNLQPLNVSVALSNSIVGSGKQVLITAHVTNITNGSPVENANVTLFSVIGGSFATSLGLTNSTGHFTATFTTPNVTEIEDIAIFATASKPGFAEGSDYKYLTVLPTLSIQVTVNPSKIKSEETATLTVLVTHQEQPLANASVTVSSDIGNLSATEGITNSEGKAVFIFTAPQTTTLLNATITAMATKTGYTEAQRQTTITIEPKVLAVDVSAKPAALTSETTSQITVQVTYEGTPISNATVNIASDSGGIFSPTTAITSSNGSAMFNFTAPLVNAALNLTITVNATKTGYAQGEDRLQMTVSPGTLDVQIIAVPTTIESEATSTVTVIVTHNGTPIEGATVTVSSDGGSFSEATQITNINGNGTFVFNAPKTATQLSVTITATATKNGYISGENQAVITVTPKLIPETVGGLPLTTILIILIPVAIAAIIAVLIKLKILVITFKEKPSS